MPSDIDDRKIMDETRYQSDYLDRIISPSETVERLRPVLKKFGITRIADQTDLDVIGIPCFASFRPNAKRLANNQGKGLTRAAAKASATMEALEFAVAEAPLVKILHGTVEDLVSQGLSIVEIRHLLPIGDTLQHNKNLNWVTGYNLLTKNEVLIPLDAVDLDQQGTELGGICKGTNGLASGNSREEAVFHGLCELIERDALTLWSLCSFEEQSASAINTGTLQDKAVLRLLDMIDTAGLKIQLFDQTSDIGIPCIMAVLGDPNKFKFSHFDLSAGYGAHPNADRAVIRAITEAAQSRITSIAASRDDIIPSEYDSTANEKHVQLLRIVPDTNRRLPQGTPSGLSLSNAFATAVYSVNAISDAEEIFVFPMNDESQHGFSVVKIIAPFLEDRGANSNWRPKKRALRKILGS